ncbi:hypothetical protein B0E45_17730 [Sinorhizobium sp. A49]|uniref:SgcJ/EcaC family oxidoreductase n=1 Tax=Sinorhizobium sp. A49 TaxID=1945861 RepID=UPI0009850BC2|nr:SgcJ/EcaC family oxidoreductase [Sinorhizobium sp. A49]OOG68685.1 hypothetical protein B0E45_17730 [Sinorhizobium sp. A49]
MTKTRDEIEGERIRQLIADVEKAQNERSPEDFLRHFMPDAVWVTAFGRRLTGRDEISAFTRKVLTPALGNQYARYEAEHITFLRPDVAAVNVRQRPVFDDGSPIPGEAEGSPLYVLVKEGERWMIAIGQNTKVQTEAIVAQQNQITSGDEK